METITQLAITLPWLYLGLVTLLGLLVGSFLNVVIHRLPIMLERSWQQEYAEYFGNPETACSTEPYNLVVPRSACPHCGHLITALENIPIISWLCLRGRCRSCQAPISARYPLVELLTGIASLVIAYYLPPSTATLAALLFTWFLVAMTFIDLDKMLLPDQLTLPLLWLGLLLNLNHLFTDLASAVIGAAAGYMVLWCVYWGFKLLTGKDGMGYGDFKLLAAFGAWFGWQTLPLILILSSLVGAIVGISLVVTRKHHHANPIPFGPYLCMAGWIALLWGNTIIQWYWRLML